MSEPGRFHYFRGDTLVEERDGRDADLMERMLERKGMSWDQLLKPENAREYAMAVLTCESGSARAEFFDSAEPSLSPTAEMRGKQFNPGDPAFTLSDEARAEAENEFKAWALEHGYEPVVSNLSARQHLA